MLLLLGACGDDSTTAGGGPGGSGGAGAGEVGGAGGSTAPLVPGNDFDRFCGSDPWDAALSPTVEGQLNGVSPGVIPDPFPVGTLDTMKFVPSHPLRVKTIRIAFGGDPGIARVRLMTTFGRSYPGGWPDLDTASANLIAPIDVDVSAPDPEVPMEIDVSAEGVFLAPTQHYLVVIEHLGDQPKVALESTAPGEPSRGLIHVPNTTMTPLGLGPWNFRVELTGDYFCQWGEPDRWFAAHPEAPFALEPAEQLAVTDLNGDGHDDVVIHVPGPHMVAATPKAYLGDGSGTFEPAVPDPFAALPSASLLVFADLDGDGDRDAFAGTYLDRDHDGDSFTIASGDCNDDDKHVRPNATEATNGKDDDCDGVADDGLDPADGDGDGVSVLDGDCDDTDAAAAPGTPEVIDWRDNNCDGVVDDGFSNHIALNDGAGAFSVLANAGVETREPSTTAAFADPDRDGDLDLYWGNWLVSYESGLDAAVASHFVTGNGDGTFVEATASAGMQTTPTRPTYGVGFVDYNSDGWQDLYVGNYRLKDNQLWENQQNGIFLDVAAEKNVHHDGIETEVSQWPGGHSYGSAFGDVDNDGDIDAFVANLSHPRTQPWADPSQFYFNNGAPSFDFTDRREELGILYDEGDVNAVFADWDNDGDLDLVIASVYPWHFARLYRNDGAQGFRDVTYEAGIRVHFAGAIAWSDVDEDGDLDLFARAGYGDEHVLLYENRVGDENAWLELELVGDAQNRDAVGAQVFVTADGVRRVRQVEAGSGHHLQQSHVLHFGLGLAQDIEEVLVLWPDGTVEQVSSAQPRSRYRIVQGDGVVSGF